jgi:p-methyltransferase
MNAPSCLIIGAAEPERAHERQIRLDATAGRQTDGWGRFLALNYASFDNDAFMSHQLASVAHLTGRGLAHKEDGFFRYADVSMLSSWRTPLLGGMFVYQYLKERGFEVDLIQHVQLQAGQLKSALAAEPTVIAISTTLITSPMEMRTLVKYCRERSPASFIVLGGMSMWNQFQARKADLERRAAEDGRLAGSNGSEATAAEGTGDLMAGVGFLGADALVVDPYGVETLAEILRRFRDDVALDHIPNTVVFENEVAIASLDRQGESFDPIRMSMNWDLVEDDHIGRIVNIRTQISCPFRCSFCSYPITQGPVIKAEIDMFEKELQVLARRGVERLMIVDDTFNVPPKRFVEILNVLRKYHFGWYAFIRCQFLKKEQVDLMKASGCMGVYLGLESIDADTLQRMNKQATPDEFRRGIEYLASRDIMTYASFIVGFPGDRPDTALKTKAFVENSGLDYYNLKPFWYDHATPISQRAAEFGLTGQGYNWKHATMDAGQAYDTIENLIVETKGRYAGLHSGELWEVGQLEARGLSKSHIDAIYDAHGAMLRHDLARTGSAADKQQIFSGLVSALRDVALTPAPW